MLILIGMMSLNSFSQNVIDSTSIRLKKPIARLVIKDLIIGDGIKKELSLSVSKTRLLEQKVVLKDSIISNLHFQITNFNSILSTKGSQLEFTKQLNDKLRLEIKKQRLKNKLLGGAGLIAIGGVILILK